MTAATATPLARNVTRAFRAADFVDQHVGRTWYGDALALARELSPDDVARGAGVIAALSPRLQWTANANAARRAFADGHASGVLGANARKADRILAGESPLDVLGGRKVRAFYACILAGGVGTDAVCVDMHAWNIAVGNVTDDGGAAALARVGQYDRAANAYRHAARILSRELGEDIAPCVVQAVTWVYWRRTEHARHLSAARRASRTAAA